MAKAARRFAATERWELWRRWKRGESISAIAQALDRGPGTIYRVISKRGGVSPPERRRSRHALTLNEREEISRGIAVGRSARQIAASIGRSNSTVSREIARHGGRSRYRATEAESRAWDKARRPQQCKLAANTVLRRLVAAKLSEHWSPEQIAAWLKINFPSDDTMHVSHETIYLSLFVQARGALKKELLSYLRRAKKGRRPRRAEGVGRRQRNIIDAVSISERPAEVEDRAVPGHWEGDLLIGSKNTQIATLVERQSRFVMLVKVNSKDTETVVEALTKTVLTFPKQLRASLTWDRGSEMAAHKQFSVATNVDVYFCDPQSPWQRGSNENTNGLLRQYFPKGTDLSVHSQAHLNKVARQLNTRPRQTLGFQTPAATLEQALQ